ncbi:MAG TPA: hypothetical protein PK999_18485 [Nitrospira sp.]|jgi:hypothetical protein|nr:hypothetical protein [Nitrospira sp.]
MTELFVKVAGEDYPVLKYEVLECRDSTCVALFEAQELLPVDGYVLDGSIVLRTRNGHPFGVMLGPPDKACIALTVGYGLFFAMFQNRALRSEGLIRGAGYGKRC